MPGGEAAGALISTCGLGSACHTTGQPEQEDLWERQNGALGACQRPGQRQRGASTPTSASARMRTSWPHKKFGIVDYARERRLRVDEWFKEKVTGAVDMAMRDAARSSCQSCKRAMRSSPPS